MSRVTADVPLRCIPRTKTPASTRSRLLKASPTEQTAKNIEPAPRDAAARDGVSRPLRLEARQRGRKRGGQLREIVQGRGVMRFERLQDSRARSGDVARRPGATAVHGQWLRNRDDAG